MNRVRAFFLAARPKTLPAATVPVAVGSACAFVGGGFRLGPALAALFGAIFIQIGANFANDVFDFEKGTDDELRVGPMRAVQAGWLSPRAMRIGMAISFSIATAFGVYLSIVSGPVVIAIGCVSIAAGIAYTAGPFPLGYHGLGDVFVFIFFGWVPVCGTEFVQTGTLTMMSVWAGMVVGALSTAILVVNNTRDVEGDGRARKRTLVVRWGRRFGYFQYRALLVVAYALIAGLAAFEQRPLLLLPLLTLPFGVVLSREIQRREGAALNATLARTAVLLVLTGGLLSLGLVIA